MYAAPIHRFLDEIEDWVQTVADDNRLRSEDYEDLCYLTGDIKDTMACQGIDALLKKCGTPSAVDQITMLNVCAKHTKERDLPLRPFIEELYLYGAVSRKNIIYWHETQRRVKYENEDPDDIPEDTVAPLVALLKRARKQ